jgi:hypothetical protein
MKISPYWPKLFESMVAKTSSAAGFYLPAIKYVAPIPKAVYRCRAFRAMGEMSVEPPLTIENSIARL